MYYGKKEIKLKRELGLLAAISMVVGNFIKNSIVPLLGFAYVTYVIYGSGAETVMWGFLLMLIGIQFYLYIKVSERIKKI